MINIDDVSRIVKNTLFLNISTIVTRGLSFITLIVLARYLGTVGFGRYTFALYFTGMFIILTKLGLDYLTVREVARDKSAAGKYLGHNFIIRVILGTITFILIFLIVNILNYSPVVKTVVYILAFYTIVKSLGGSFNSIFMAFERMGFMAFLNVFLASFVLVGILIGISLKHDLINLLWVYPLAVMAYICLGLALVIKKLAKPKLEFNFKFAKDLVKNSLPFAVIAVFSTIFTHIDIVMLKTIRGDIPTGYYGVSRALISALLFIPANFITVIYPVFSRLYRSSRDSLIKYYEKSFYLLLILALPIATGGMILANRFILLFYGQQYLPATISLQILVWALAVQFIGSSVDTLMLSTDRQKIVAWVAFWAMCLNIILNLILIPRFSYVGASISTVISYLLTFIVFFIIISRNIHRLNLLELSVKPIVATLLMGIFVYLLRDINLLLIIFTSAVFYLFILYLLKGIKRSDMDLLKQLVKRNSSHT